MAVALPIPLSSCHRLSKQSLSKVALAVAKPVRPKRRRYDIICVLTWGRRARTHTHTHTPFQHVARSNYHGRLVQFYVGGWKARLSGMHLLHTWYTVKNQLKRYASSESGLNCLSEDLCSQYVWSESQDPIVCLGQLARLFASSLISQVDHDVIPCLHFY